MSASSKLSLKLLIDQTANRVLLAEAGKETIDFLFSLLTLPVGTVVRLLSKQGMVGSFVNLYESVEDLNVDYLQPNQNKDSLLKPDQNKDILFKPIAASTSTTQENYNSSLFSIAAAPKKSVFCPAPGEFGTAGGFVKGVVTYMVMDDLVVKPMSTISSIALLKKYVKDVDALEEKVVDLDFDKGLKLLKMAFESKQVLTSVFLTPSRPGFGGVQIGMVD